VFEVIVVVTVDLTVTKPPVRAVVIVETTVVVMVATGGEKLRSMVESALPSAAPLETGGPVA